MTKRLARIANVEQKNMDVKAALAPGGTRISENADLQTLVEVWQDGVDKLLASHQVLRDEVQRLNDEVDEKNLLLQRKNRLADLGQVTAHVAHEVRNSLVPLTLYLSLLRRECTGDAGKMEIIEQLEAGFTGLESTVGDLLSFSADRQPEFKSFPVKPLLSEIVSSLAPQFAAQQIEVSVICDDNAALHADEAMVRRAVLNLVLNAVDVMPNGGSLLLNAAPSEDGFCIRVADTGAGMTAETAAEVLEPFFTTKSTGAGLGLAIVNRTMQTHDGQVLISSQPQQGTEFSLIFPGQPSH